MNLLEATNYFLGEDIAFPNSAVVDPAGNLLVVYHGTNQEFDDFALDTKGVATKGSTSKEGYWFTSSEEEAQQYADYSAKQNLPNAEDHEKKIADYMNRIKMAERKKDWDLAEQLTGEMEELEFGETQAEPSGQRIIKAYLNIETPYVYDVKNSAAFDQLSIIKREKNKGYDGFIFENIKDSPFGMDESTTHYLVFNTNQIQVI